MPKIHTFNVIPSLPEALAPLMPMAHDLTFAWMPDARALFRRMDPALWHAVNGNPVALLGRLDQNTVDRLAGDEGFLRHMERVREAMQADHERATWFEQTHGAPDGFLVAYFSAEYGLTEALPIYSGGLGVLSGDHLKSTAGVGLPLVGVGLLYREGYFRQYLSADGWQLEDVYDNDFANLPVQRAKTPSGEPAAVHVDIEGRSVEVRVWEVRVGRTRLLLLDTNGEGNDPKDRGITGQLYGGGSELRFKQEIVLGMGGVRALEVLGLRPTVFHMNEGHSAFLALERIGRAMADHGLGFQEARELCAASNVFTTHTPVPAGFDIFSRDQLSRYLPRIHEVLGLDREAFLRLGAHENDPELSRGFNMAYLALRSAGWINGVSQLHGKVSREMWKRLWPGAEADEVPIQAVTNGIHTRTWVAAEMASLFDRYVGGWETRTADPAVWKGVERIPDGELWQTHERRRARLVHFVRERMRTQLRRRGASDDEVEAAGEVLDPGALTIGFARRFATYKRATLLLRQPERLKALLTDPERPVQLIFAGKAHPQDDPGKQLIREIVQFGRDPEIRRRVVFLEEYDMGVARNLVQGVDVWLNNPRRPKEASGTSGMKVVVNGGLNLSVLDGWWAEAFDGTNGWAIGRGEVYDDVERGDAIEADLLLDVLEQEVVPEFYQRGPDRLPRAWLRRMKASIGGLSGAFSTDRMVQDYTEQLYLPAFREAAALEADDFAGARELAARGARLRAAWDRVSVGEVTVHGPADVPLGEALKVTADVLLGDLDPDDAEVEIYGGRVDGARRIRDGRHTSMTHAGAGEDGWHRFEGAWTPELAGQSGCTVRVRPHFERQAPVRGFDVKSWE